jgi:hypothetical protein
VTCYCFFNCYSLLPTWFKKKKYKKKQNIERFPDDFMFEFTKEEFLNLRSQIVTSNRGGSRYQPFAFTELGVAMLSSVLNSQTAIQTNMRFPVYTHFPAYPLSAIL